MDNKVQEITEKIFREGVEKGQAEAQQIVENARLQEADAIKQAQQQAATIIADARKAADELMTNTQSELQLYARRAVEALKSEIANLLNGAVVETSVKEVVGNAEWLQQLALALAVEWASKGDVVIQTADAEQLTQYFAQKAKNLLDKGVKIEQVNGIKTGFAILPADGSYKVQFGEEEFTAYFSEFLRPQLLSLLFQPSSHNRLTTESQLNHN
ncbi:MAG: hypothetical protein LBV39_06340 [Bacteroidales bacterium]|nr:hypothetical protein [Bacteroidales bacterium]